MAKAIKTCRVCGKDYEYCHSFGNADDNIYRWQDVACSPECGNIYFARVLRSRGIKPEDESLFVNDNRDDDTSNINKISNTFEDDFKDEDVDFEEDDDLFEDDGDE